MAKELKYTSTIPYEIKGYTKIRMMEIRQSNLALAFLTNISLILST